MTDEQIKQNAETAYPGFEDLQAVYIEGAKSRDEEMKQLRNPWISVEERLPGKEKLVIGTNGTHFFPVAYNKHDNNWRLVLGMIFAMEVPFSFITKWMPIPEITKGD